MATTNDWDVCGNCGAREEFGATVHDIGSKCEDGDRWRCCHCLADLFDDGCDCVGA